MQIRSLSLLILSAMLIACGGKPPPPPQPVVDTTNLSNLQDLKQFNTNKYDMSKSTDGLNPIRIQALTEAGMTVGAQGALALRSEQIDTILTNDTKLLDQTFNFNALILPNNVLPPVLVEGDHTLNLANSSTIRVADKTYKIEQQARFVTAAPTWHDYLWMSFPKPDKPNNTLLPKNKSEDKIWKSAVNDGWKKGVSQANSIFAENVARLKRDYEGIALYKKLVDQNMISTPYVATTALGVTGNGNQITVNDKVKRITSLPQLNPNAANWKPAVAQPSTNDG